MLRRITGADRPRGLLLSDEPASPFDIATPRRPLRFIVDLTSAQPSAALDLLRSLAAHESIEIAEFLGGKADAGNPSEPDPARRIREVRVGDDDPELEYMPIEIVGTENVISTGVPSDELEFIADYARGATSEAWKRDYALCYLASRERFDALVTGSDFLLRDVPDRYVSAGNPVTSKEACELVGLFLRAWDDYTYAVFDKARYSVSSGWFFFGLMRELLPESWRWYSGCSRGRDQGPDIDLGYVAQSGLERYERVLRGRDRLHVMRQLSGTRNATEEEIFAFDVMLLMLSSVFDVVATVADHAYALGTPRNDIGWRRRSWRGNLHRADAALAGLMDPGTDGGDALELVALMRNTVHGEALRTVTHRVRGRDEHLVLIPPAIARRVLELARRRGGLDAFGLSIIREADVYVDPAPYAERALRLASETLNALMASTEVERLVDDPSQLLTGPPSFDKSNPVNATFRERYRLLAGL